ncbi:Eco57I restriction-modification methylase domain-containing protein [Paraburkholderia heleia]|uniref:Eco57I restriction-modification methylase domain-containing protein n=1 Tax=Paraburkholderia heleia TaxID=634127 RepID=UPI002AB7B2F1|nr:SAM-dependent DNA methyltransferase [Paraburkholderia heleia]
MASLDRNLRKDLGTAVRKARRVAEAGARQVLEQLAVNHHEPWQALMPEQRKLRNRLRVHGRQLGDRIDDKGAQAIDRLAGECAYEHWHRLLFARFLAENDLLVEPEFGMALSLDECRELARERGVDWLVLASDFAQRMLPEIFRAGDPVLDVTLPPETRQELERLLGGLPNAVFVSDDSLGWVYQFWQADQKDSVNASEVKIGADELPAVTQLFTEDYMVLFLLHNTLGAWWAARVLATRPEAERTAGSEDDLRRVCALPGVNWEYLRFIRDSTGAWTPAAGSFLGWPKAARDISVLDPCMGSGHFLVFVLPILAAMRAAEEMLTQVEAIDSVLRDNIFGLELDPRCTQIAAFNLALAAWRQSGYRSLPPLNLACAGIGINASEDAWLRLAGADDGAKEAMRQLYVLFQQAPLFGSLIDPTRLQGELFVRTFDDVAPLLSRAIGLEREEGDTQGELAVTARGVVTTARLLTQQFTLVATNVPYLGRGDQTPQLAEFCGRFHAAAKADLATCLIERITRFTCEGGTAAVVAPRNWMFLKSYKRFRETLLRDTSIAFLAPLGPRAFETIGGEVVNVVLAGIERRIPSDEHQIFAVDAAHFRDPLEKSSELRTQRGRMVFQRDQLKSPDARLTLESHDALPLLARWASSFLGLGTGDYQRYGRQFWEFPGPRSGWAYQQGSVDETGLWGGRENVVAWDVEMNRVRGMTQADREQIHHQDQSGQQAWGRRGVVVSLSSELRCTLYSGEQHDKSVAALVPQDETLIPALWCYVTSDEFAAKVRQLDRKVIVANGTLIKVPFDVGRWKDEAASRYPIGLPAPCSEDPTQWLFEGDPSRSRAPLQVAVARLLGYEWPRMGGARFCDAETIAPDAISRHADDDGIVCIPPLRSEPAAADRLSSLLAEVYDGGWSSAQVNTLLVGSGSSAGSLERWLRDEFFSQHCDTFRQRPFVLHIWDGTQNGFGALVNYHKLCGDEGTGRKTLEKLIFTYLGDWIQRQRELQRAGVEGADGLVAAAEHLRKELERVLEGEPPYDLFARWKPLHEQPIGWDPDIDDGVRTNLRPFMQARPLGARAKDACILRTTPRISWGRGKGNDSYRTVDEYPWLWSWDGHSHDFAGGAEFDGVRWNDLHYSRTAKLAARERAKGGKS